DSTSPVATETGQENPNKTNTSLVGDLRPKGTGTPVSRMGDANGERCGGGLKAQTGPGSLIPLLNVYKKKGFAAGPWVGGF
ncbi:hypothetical protein, partial [Paenibacillus sp. GbtcB18]|uniref:hypothetical protein n=1 Tax=Paenibacillus sp. GbtcB18 TaxID=2824763 RepID=UPI001C2F712A